MLLLVFPDISEENESVCAANSEALRTLHWTQNLTVENIEHVGYGFYFINLGLPPFEGSLHVTWGLFFLPAEGIEAGANSPYVCPMWQ